MNRDEAQRLAIRIVNTWPSRLDASEWTIELIEMDAGTAGTAFARLRRQLDHAPSIAAFWRTYRELATPANQPTPCHDCDDSGWITSHEDGHGCRYAKPCPLCQHGRRAAQLDMRPPAATRPRPPDETGEPISMTEYLMRNDDESLRRMVERHPAGWAEQC